MARAVTKPREQLLLWLCLHLIRHNGVGSDDNNLRHLIKASHLQVIAATATTATTANNGQTKLQQQQL